MGHPNYYGQNDKFTKKTLILTKKIDYRNNFTYIFKKIIKA